MIYEIKFKQFPPKGMTYTQFGLVFNSRKISANSSKEAVKYLKEYMGKNIEIIKIEKVITLTKLKITFWSKIIRFLRKFRNE